LKGSGHNEWGEEEGNQTIVRTRVEQLRNPKEEGVGWLDGHEKGALHFAGVEKGEKTPA